VAPLEERTPYTLDDALEGLFLERGELEHAMNIWKAKKNLIIQGPPGVGKTFIAKRLAYALMHFRDPSRVGLVQFHQSYSYEDFVQRYRPTQNGLSLKDGLFLEFCRRAARRCRLCAHAAFVFALASEPGVRVEIVNGYRTDAAGRTILLDLAYGGEAWALLRLIVPRSIAEADDAEDVHLVTASLAYADLDGRAAHSEPVHLRLPIVSAGAFAAMPVNERVSSRIAELNAAELQEQARSAAQRSDWSHVQRLLQQLRTQAVSSPWLSASIAELEGYAFRQERELFAKEALYTAGAMRNRLAALDEQLGWSAEFEAAKASFLRRKLEQGRRFGAAKQNPDRS
jgi:hypothetical protein